MINQNRYRRSKLTASLLACWINLMTLPGCSRKNVQAPVPAKPAATDNSYMDLEPGWKLRIVVPVTKSGAFRVALTPQSNGHIVTMSADDLIGYETLRYVVDAKGRRGVRLKFASAGSTKDGQTVAQPGPPTLPFQLPKGTGHIRLLYFVRVSQADHNMAIVASRRLEALNTATRQIKAHPSACRSTTEIFCSWVPAGIAVRPEPQ